MGHRCPRDVIYGTSITSGPGTYAPCPANSIGQLGNERPGAWIRRPEQARIVIGGWNPRNVTDRARGIPAELARILERQHDVIARGQALAAGMTRRMVHHRLRGGGPWQVLLPGVYLAVTGVSTDDQKEMAALLYGGSASVITGTAALRRQGIRVQQPTIIDVLIPASIKRTSTRFVRVYRSTRMPEQVVVVGAQRYAFPARAVADAARGVTKLRDARAIVAAAVQARRCPLNLLIDEVAQGPTQRSAHLRRVLAEVVDGVRSVAEADFHDLIMRAGLPQPIFNARLYDAAGNVLAFPDAWWPDAGVAAEVDSREWHLSPEEWEQTMTRHARMSACGILVLHFSPRQIRSRPAEVVAAIKNALAAGSGRPRLPIEVRPAE